MSKAKIASATTPTLLPSQSAWAKGAPPISDSVASPRTISHSRRPSALRQGVPIKEGVSVPRSNVAAVRQGGSVVTFGSIDDLSSPFSSLPAATAVVKTESAESFGSVPATPSTHVNGKTPASVSTTGPSKLPARPTSSNVTPPSVTPSTLPSTTSAPTKPVFNKADVTKLFQGSSSASSQPSSSKPPVSVSTTGSSTLPTRLAQHN